MRSCRKAPFARTLPASNDKITGLGASRRVEVEVERSHVVMEFVLFHCVGGNTSADLMIVDSHLVKVAINMEPNKEDLETHSTITVLLIDSEPGIESVWKRCKC